MCELMREFDFSLSGGEASYSYGHEKQKNASGISEWKPQLEIYQFIEWIDLEFC